MTLTDQINRIGAQFGVPPAILGGVVQVESGGDVNVKPGAAGEIGLAQLLPSTAGALGVNPYTVEGNLTGAAKLLAQNFSRFGNWPAAIGAYNASPAGATGPSGKLYSSKVLSAADALSGSGTFGALQNQLATTNTAVAAAGAGGSTSGSGTTPQGIIANLPSFVQAPAAAAKAGIPSGIIFVIGLALSLFGLRSIIA